MSDTFSIVVDKEGDRLDSFISEKCPRLTRTHAKKLITGGYITVNNAVVKPSYRLTTGDAINVFIPPTPPSALIPEKVELDIIYEDNDVLVVNKPAGFTVHPAPGHAAGTLVNAILAHYPPLADISDSVRPGVVHRLDKDTSGVMLVAKNKAAHLDLAEQFRAKTVHKVYLALVKGRITPESGVIEAPLGRDPANRKKIAVVQNGREAITEYRVIKYLDGYSFLELTPQTGRTHQIRVHLAAIGYPVVGDATYGTRSSYVSRQFLHAHRLGFKLPSTGRYVEFTSPLPADLQQAMQSIG